MKNKSQARPKSGKQLPASQDRISADSSSENSQTKNREDVSHRPPPFLLMEMQVCKAVVLLRILAEKYANYIEADSNALAADEAVGIHSLALDSAREIKTAWREAHRETASQLRGEPGTSSAAAMLVFNVEKVIAVLTLLAEGIADIETAEEVSSAKRRSTAPEVSANGYIVLANDVKRELKAAFDSSFIRWKQMEESSRIASPSAPVMRTIPGSPGDQISVLFFSAQCGSVGDIIDLAPDEWTAIQKDASNRRETLGEWLNRTMAETPAFQSLHSAVKR